MLTRLYIENFGLIERTTLDVARGLTVLTGETGAGKSMLIGAINALFGAKNSLKNAVNVRTGTEQAIIEATLQLQPNHPAHQWLLEHGFSPELGNEFTLKRLLPAEGPSRSFCNGQRITQPIVQELGEFLLDIHSQHDTQQLRRASVQRNILDRFGKHQQAVRHVQQTYQAWQQALSTLSERQAQLANATARSTELEQLIEQLTPLAPLAEQLEVLSDEQQRLTHAIQIGEALQEAHGTLQSEQGLLDALGRASRTLSTIASKAPTLGSLSERFNSLSDEASDLSRELQHELETTQPDPTRLDELNTQLNQLKNIARQHQVMPEQLPEFLAQTTQELAVLGAGESGLAALEQAANAAQQEFAQACEALTKARQSAKPKLEQAVQNALQNLHMATTKFEVTLEELAEPHQHGAEQIILQVAVNPGQPLENLSKAASGGEVSRLMLALKQILLATMPAQLVVFDEIDTGISGAVASSAGAALQDLAQHQQVLAITHLPQVAACGQQHWKIEKTTNAENTQTTVATLNAAERQNEIARLLAGSKTTSAAQAAAAELLQNAA